jgi:heptosyltransferase-2
VIPRRILLVRLSALGDVVLATPAARALRKRFPEAEIDWLVESPYLPLIEANPHVHAFAYEKHGRHAGSRGWLALRRELAQRGYDLVVDLQAKPKTRLLRGVGRESLALRKRSFGETLLALLGRDPPLERAHAVDLYLEALAPIGVEPDGRALELHLSERMKAEAEPVLPQGRRVAIAPGARWATKRWPIERFAQVAAALHESGLQPLLIGGPGEAEQMARIRAALPAGVRAPDTTGLSIGGLAAAIGACELMVAGDSGPAHLASALGVPLVAIFGPTSPRRWGPVSERAAVVRLPLDCSPCSNHGTARCPHGDHRCMTGISTEAVLEQAWSLLAASGARRSAP